MQKVVFSWDPICPFAWITSRWVVKVEAALGLDVDWRFLCLRILNEHKDYERDFPPGYPELHEKGRRMLRVAAAVRADHGPGAMGVLYTAYGTSIWDRDPVEGGDRMAPIATPAHLRAVLHAAGLPTSYAEAADDATFDTVLRADTEAALAKVGSDVGTPIVAVDPPDGPAFFGPVISRVPADDEAVALWEAVLTLARWPGFAELKRSLREVPRLRLLGAVD